MGRGDAGVIAKNHGILDRVVPLLSLVWCIDGRRGNVMPEYSTSPPHLTYECAPYDVFYAGNRNR